MKAEMFLNTLGNISLARKANFLANVQCISVSNRGIIPILINYPYLKYKFRTVLYNQCVNVYSYNYSYSTGVAFRLLYSMESFLIQREIEIGR